MEKRGVDYVLLVTDSFLHQSEMPEPLKKALSDSKICCTICDKMTKEEPERFYYDVVEETI